MGGGIKVHGLPISTATMRVLATLYEKGLDFEIVPVDMKAGAHKQEPLISLNVRSNSLHSFGLVFIITYLTTLLFPFSFF